MFRSMFAALALLVSFSATSKEVVAVIWPFSPASNQATAVRVLIENANKSQDKYTFVFENRPGAGGSIAVNSVINAKKPEILTISSSVFVRPMFYPAESHDLSAVKPLATLSLGSPAVVISKKHKTLQEFLASKNPSLGIVAGSITEVVGRELRKHNPSLILVPYPGTINATKDAMGGHIDASVEFVRDALARVEDGSMSGLGVTGTLNVPPMQTFSSQKVTGLTELSINYFAVVSSSMPNEMAAEFHKIFVKANSEANVQTIWAGDHASVPFDSPAKTLETWTANRRYWDAYKATLN